MFDDQPQNNQTPKPTTPQPPKVEDMFGRTDPTVAGQNIKTPIQPGQASHMRPAEVRGEDLYGGRSILGNKLLILEIIGFILVVFGGGGFLVYMLFFKSDIPVANTNQPVINNQSNTNQPATENGNTNQNQPVVNNEPVVEVKDTDRDGLTDDEEKELGTDPKMTDTDGDGLNDRAEVEIYKTDPLNPDTDGDGYKDGQEVINNYDPTRPGSAKLYEIPR